MDSDYLLLGLDICSVFRGLSPLRIFSFCFSLRLGRLVVNENLPLEREEWEREPIRDKESLERKREREKKKRENLASGSQRRY